MLYRAIRMIQNDSERSGPTLYPDKTVPVAATYRLSNQDALFLYAESENGPLHIGSIGIFEGRLDFAQLIDHIGSRLHLVPRYRHRLRGVGLNLAHPILEDDPGFRIENHVIRHRLPLGIRISEAIDDMMRCFESRLDRSRPLWEIHSFEGLEETRTALVSKVHHALVDGVAGVELLKVMFDLAPNAMAIEPVPWKPQRPSSRFERLTGALRERANTPLRIVDHFERSPNGLGKDLRMMADAARVVADLAMGRIVATPWNSSLVSRRRSLAWSRFPLAEAKAIRGSFDGSINDLALTILTEGAARYLTHLGYDTKGCHLRIGCPVNVRSRQEQATLGNRVSMVFPLLPAWPMDVIKRLWLVSHETQRIKAAGLAQAFERLTALAGELIPPLLEGLASQTCIAALDSLALLARASGYQPRPDKLLLPAFGINFVATNIRGIQAPLYILGHKCSEQIPLVPLGGTLGYGVAILSYNQNLYFAMLADPRLVPDLALMKFYVEEAFAELRMRCRELQQPSPSCPAESPQRPDDGLPGIP